MFDYWKIHLLNFFSMRRSNVEKVVILPIPASKEKRLENKWKRNYSQSFVFISNKIPISGYFRNVNKHLCIYSFLETASRKRQIHTMGQFHFWNVASNSMNSRAFKKSRERERRGQNWPYPVAEQRMNVMLPDFHSLRSKEYDVKSFEIRKI